MSKVLIVDDQPHLQELFSLELIDEGYKVISVSDAESVIECVRDSKPDLVLLDLCLNGFEGFDLLHGIKAEYPHLPVLIVTAYDSYAADLRVSQADGYWVKNFFHFDELKEKILEVLGQKPSTQGPWRETLS